MRIRFNETIFNLAANGAGESNGISTFFILQEDNEFSVIENAIKNGLDSISLVDDADETIRSFEGYDGIDSINKYYNLNVGGTIYSEVIKVVLYRTNRDALEVLTERVDNVVSQTQLMQAQVEESVNSAVAEVTTASSDITDIQMALADVYEMCCSIMEAVNA